VEEFHADTITEVVDLGDLLERPVTIATRGVWVVSEVVMGFSFPECRIDVPIC
jgi:hypothetical protein